jgi:UDP-N-acetylmuramyl-tripeptide synthetase
MIFKDLIPQDLSDKINKTLLEKNISDIATDSRLVKKDSIFFALKGIHNDGAKFIDSALEKGVSIIICSSKSTVNIDDDKIIKVPNIDELLIYSLKALYPNLPKNILAITGTNGKTSVAEFVRQMGEIIGKKFASIGTTGIKVSDDSIYDQLTPFSLTTPDIVSLYKNLSILQKNGVDDVVLEASSIGLDQNRLSGIKIGLGAFTNLTQDHLDYHKSMLGYFDSKMLLFKDLIKSNAIAVLNSDIQEFSQIKEIVINSGHQVFSYGKSGVDLRIISTNLINKEHNSYQEFNFELFGQKHQSQINILGKFQIENISCALLCIASYYKLQINEIKKIVDNLDKITTAKGRMQKVITLENNAQVFIDYAHTPDALCNALKSIKELPHNNLLVLFGCGGNRDEDKRHKMGEIACDFADLVIVSDDNPRTENPELIRKQILQGCDKNKTIEISGRKQAIEEAVKKLKENDILIIAGKGHENYQIIGTDKITLDEEGVILNAIYTKL